MSQFLSLFNGIRNKIRSFTVNTRMSEKIKQNLRHEKTRLDTLVRNYPLDHWAFNKKDEESLYNLDARFEEGNKTSNHDEVVDVVRELADFYEKKVNGSI